MELITTCQTPLGPVTMACSQEGLTGLWFEGQKYFGLFPRNTRPATLPPLIRPGSGWKSISAA